MAVVRARRVIHGLTSLYLKAEKSFLRSVGMDFGLLLLRLFFGLGIASHGAQKLWGWFGGPGISGTAKFLEGLGYSPGKAFAVISGASEFGGGLLLAAGLFTPLGAAMVLGVMLNAAIATWNQGFYLGTEKPLMYAAVAVVLGFTGPGKYALDYGRSWGRGGAAWGLAAIGLGVIAALLTLLVRK